jgi:hypothetical protein
MSNAMFFAVIAGLALVGVVRGTRVGIIDTPRVWYVVAKQVPGFDVGIGVLFNVLTAG